ncbi:MAG: cupin domain-containing protein [Gammaproteobacteria bacterium]|nr:cupin domain-containing protein [Gammaproteobacteria bacterium]
MPHPDTESARFEDLLAERLVRYAELRPCTTAFIDTRTPGSAEKENFTIIGPGVSESQDQHVHIETPHGFNIGGARQPPGCVNSQHSHETAEVFVVYSGRWAFCLGPNKEDGEVVLEPGDTISIPIHMFRGFKNIGNDFGFLFGVLGGDDPGHVTWAPYVFDNAKEYGLILLEDGSLVDTAKGEQIPEGKRAMPPTTEADVARLKRLTAEDLADCILPHDKLKPTRASGLPEINESPIIGGASPDEGLDAGQMTWSHGFHLRHLAIVPDVVTKPHTRAEEEVILMYKGQLSIDIAGGSVDLGPGDIFTVPIGAPHRFANRGDELVEAYVVRGGDHPTAATVVE